ncbi:hypothetical protein QTO34_009920 [Cnephaeus nilssonii]|uniref:Uncharacterized protein n=1 Tax=Cnephaeus nilssonii TaxID=3371016 RepID=A0AA40HEE6_CNENI|nr:hypothetical protein QTO34_009920 [Eptesicus nilssonii]
MAITNKSQMTLGEDVEKRGTLVQCWWECRLVKPLWKTVSPEFNSDSLSKEEDPSTVASRLRQIQVQVLTWICFQFDVFVGRDPFKADPFWEIGLFGGGPFKGSDPCTLNSCLQQSSPDAVAMSGAEPVMQPASAVTLG